MQTVGPSPLIFQQLSEESGSGSRDLVQSFYVQQTVEVESPVKQIDQNALLVHINRALHSQQSLSSVGT